MSLTLSEADWGYFQDRDFFTNLIATNSDVLIIGSARSGKNKLLRDLGINSGVNINCCVLKVLTAVQHELFFLLQKKLMGVTKRNVSSFEGLLRLAPHASVTNKIYVVFRNADVFFLNSPRDFETFFENYRSFVNEMYHNFVDLQTIVLSRTDLDLPFFKIHLPYPSEEKMNSFIFNRMQQTLAENKTKTSNKNIEAQLQINFKDALLCMKGFDIMVKDFDYTEMYHRKLFGVLEMCYLENRNGNFEVNDQIIFINARKLFYQNPKAIFYKKSKIFKHASSFSVNDTQESKFRAMSSEMDSAALSFISLPFISKCFLIAIFICQSYKASDDEALMGNLKTARTRASSRKVQPIEQVRTKNKYVKLWRVINMTEMIMKHASIGDIKCMIENSKVFHTNEFYLCLNLLERLGLVETIAQTKFDKNLRLNCSLMVLELIKNDLGFGDQIQIL